MVRLNGAKRRAQRGFTLIELMIAVVVIAILAVVVIPQFTGSSRKVKADSEVSPMFSEISTRQEQWKSENGVYRTLAECPTVTSPTGVASTTCSGTAEWTSMRINPQTTTLRCKYQTFTGTTTGTNNPSGFTWSSPPTNWFYILATCDTDGSSGTNSTFFIASSDATIQKLNEGK